MMKMSAYEAMMLVLAITTVALAALQYSAASDVHTMGFQQPHPVINENAHSQ